MPASIDLQELMVDITRQDLVRYAGAANDYLPQHWDQAMMQAKGFADVVVHGWLGFAHLIRAATQVLTPDRWRLAGSSVRYRKPLFPGKVICGGTVREIAHDRCTVSGWLKNAGGTIATTAELTFCARMEP